MDCTAGMFAFLDVRVYVCGCLFFSLLLHLSLAFSVSLSVVAVGFRLFGFLVSLLH